MSTGMTSQRHLGMDWLRIGAFALLILYHIGMYFVPWGWHVKIAEPLEWVVIPMRALNSWRLPLLFLVSGYASAALFAKLGSTGAFVRSRSARLLIPLVFGIIVVIPPQPWIDLTGQHGYTGGFGYFWLHDYFRFGALDGIVLPTWQHLWFVVYLWVYTLLAAAVLAWVPERTRAMVADGAARWLAGLGMLAIPLIGWLLIFALVPGEHETHALVDDWPTHAHYLIPFTVGWLLRVRPALFGAVARCWRIALTIGIVAFGFITWAEYMWPGNTPSPPGVWEAFDIARLLHGWTTIIVLVAFADAHWNRDHRWRATLAEAVFPFYIIHQTIIVVVGWYLRQASVAALPSFLTLVATTVAGCWLFYWIGRNIGWIRPLIGLQRT